MGIGIDLWHQVLFIYNSNGRYIVFLFHTDEFEGEVISSQEGAMHWISKDELSSVNTVKDLKTLLQVMLDDNLTEFQYVIKDDKWQITIK